MEAGRRRQAALMPELMGQSVGQGTFESVLVANRGEIARRVIRTVQRMGLKAIAVYSEADATLPFVKEADDAVLLGAGAPAESYLDVAKVLEAAHQSGAQAIHPGYGFLSENAAFAQAVADAGLVWIGPSPQAILAMGDKVAARNLVGDAGVPIAPGTREPVADVEAALLAARVVGYPLMVKAAGGGGGIGMSVARDDEELATAFVTAQSRAERFFGNPSILLERYVSSARHVEVQILGLADGRVVALGERDCSVQRRHQKVAEETPCPVLTPALRARMVDAAVRAGESVGYRGAGTVEFLLDPSSLDSGGEFYFLEMNARLQVEHPITELVTGVDLVEQQLLTAAGLPPSFDPDAVVRSGHAIELRIYAEDPKRFLPSPGTISRWVEPAGVGVRVDSGYAQGDVVTPFYDPLLAKLCVHGPDREAALELARGAVGAFEIEGLKTNLPFFAELLGNEEFISGRYDTGLIDRMRAPQPKPAQ
jgi:acetyl-CoA carboxylase, biotin carboxylase subunit